MAIPFKSLRYGPGRDQTWGINLRRVVRWKNEWSHLTQIPRALTTFRGILKVSSAGTLVGLQVPRRGPEHRVEAVRHFERVDRQHDHGRRSSTTSPRTWAATPSTASRRT